MERPNLIQFPVEKTRKTREDISVQISVNTLTDRRRVGFVLSLMSVVMLAVYLNPQNHNFDVVRYSADGGRMIASVDSSDSLFSRDEVFESELAKSLGSPLGRSPASFGRAPTAEDQLRDEDLKSRYRFEYQGHQISGIYLPEGSGLNFKPVDIQDRQKLLEKYKALFYPEAERVEPLVSSPSESLREETYAFLKNEQVLGRARIKLDRYGAFYSLQVLNHD